jgi:hypothetical protein
MFSPAGAAEKRWLQSTRTLAHLTGIAKQVQQDLLDLDAVDHDRIGGLIDLEADPSLPFIATQLDRLVHRLPQAVALSLWRGIACLLPQLADDVGSIR